MGFLMSTRLGTIGVFGGATLMFGCCGCPVAMAIAAAVGAIRYKTI